MNDFKGFSIKAKAKEAEIYLYDEIGSGWFGGVSAKQFADELKALGKLERITVRLNSPGGDVFDGLAIHNILKQNPAQVDMYVDGLAASIASIIAMAGDSINMAENAMMMIHEPWTMALGNAAEMREIADRLEKVSGVLLGTYTRRTGKDEQEIADLMVAETWMTAQEALDMGFADSIVEEMQMAAHFDLDKFKFRHNPLADKAKVEDKPEADAKPDSEGEPMLPEPDLSCFDRGIERCEAILNQK